MKDQFEYVIVILTRQVNGPIEILPTEKINIREFREKNGSVINFDPEKPDDYFLDQFAKRLGVTTDFVVTYFSNEIHPKNGMQDSLLAATFDYLGAQGWLLITVVQADSNTRYIFSRKK